MNKAFVLGAGLGERLRPLTDRLPKPLIPVYHKRLITYAFDHLLAAGVREFIVNTHHLPQEYARAFPESSYRGVPIHFRHEAPVRLETAGGIANVRDLLGDEPFIVYNGDILTDLPLERLLDAHQRRGNMVTLALRSRGPAQHIAMNHSTGRITDIRGKLGTGNAGELLFTGIYAVEPAFLELLTPGKAESVIPVFLSMIERGLPLGGVVLDEGQWWDLGNRDSYLEAHRALRELNSHFPAYASVNGRARREIAPDAKGAEAASLRGCNIIGAGATIEPGALLEDCILWPGARVLGDAVLRRCIVCSGAVASGAHQGEDI
jgi:mannose-1-phosphate guanylyltransferase/mannose-1-phosphate guanylyltransferase/phosphomannomutase